MSKVHLCFGDCHAIPGMDNARADWLAQLILDMRPDVVISLGDTADMQSLCSYDRGLKSFQGRTYKADIDVHGDFQERLWSPVRKAKKKLPRRITLHGNHEQRIHRAIELSPELEGTIGYRDLDLQRWYDTIVEYDGSTPGIQECDGILYSHYFTSGNMGRPIGTEHPANALIQKKLRSCTMGHSHIFDARTRTDGAGRKLHGLVAPCYISDRLGWAGNANDLWDRGVIVKTGVDNGSYDVSFISMNRIRKVYG